MCVIAGNTGEVLGLFPAYHRAGEYITYLKKIYYNMKYYCTLDTSFRKTFEKMSTEHVSAIVQ